jgi:hypothetical protein
MADTWYRGEAEGVTSSRPGSDPHDFGDGLYFTSDLDVAKLYANVRANGNPQLTRVYEVPIQQAKLGRVLNLTVDQRWGEFMRERATPDSQTNEQLIRMVNENYGRFFQAFLQKESIDLRHYDSVIGPEYVRGGKQLCLLMKNGLPARAAVNVRDDFKLVFYAGKEVESATVPPINLPGAPAVPIDIPTTNSRIGKAMGNQAGVAMAGVLLETLFMGLADMGIEYQVRKQLQSKYRDAIGLYLSQGQGVLVIIGLAQRSQEDFNGFRSRMLLSVNIQPGPTPEAAMRSWYGVPRYLIGAPEMFEAFDEYSWIAPGP